MVNREVLEPRFYKKYDSRGVSCRVNRKGFVWKKFWGIIIGVVGVGKKDNFRIIFTVNFFKRRSLKLPAVDVLEYDVYYSVVLCDVLPEV